MRSEPFRSLLARGRRPPERIFYTNIWFRGHTNRRYEELLPRLTRVDPYLLTCSDRRAVRAVQYRALRAASPLRHRLTFAMAASRYANVLSSDPAQLPFARGRVVIDLDDPRFTALEASQLRSPNLAACVVTTQAAARRLAALGVDVPCPVIPQGVSLGSLDAGSLTRARGRRGPEGLVVGYVAACLGVEGDDVDPLLYRVDHLLDLWERFRQDRPDARLWLVGRPGRALSSRCRGRDDIVLLGRLEPADALAHVACFDIGLYPRQVDHVPGRSAIKIAEYLGSGVPVVAYDLEVTEVVGTCGGGILASTPEEFVGALARLAGDPGLRSELSSKAGAYGRTLDWDRLASVYQDDVLDRFLPGSPAA